MLGEATAAPGHHQLDEDECQRRDTAGAAGGPLLQSKKLHGGQQAGQWSEGGWDGGDRTGSNLHGDRPPVNGVVTISGWTIPLLSSSPGCPIYAGR